MKRAGWQPPPWFDLPGRRIHFIRQLHDVEDVRRGDPAHRGGFVVSFVLTPHDVPPRRVTVQFLPLTPDNPRVYVDGPAESPHRYSDGTLCMWYPRDPVELRWTPADGAAELVTRIGVHLIKEEWYRQTGEWIGPEIGHPRRDPLNDPEL